MTENCQIPLRKKSGKGGRDWTITGDEAAEEFPVHSYCGGGKENVGGGVLVRYQSLNI